MQLLSICYQKTFKSAANPHKHWVSTTFHLIRTLFPVRCKSCFTLLFLVISYQFDTLLFLIYMVPKLMYPNCTQDKILPKVMTRHNFLKQDYVATIGYTVCNQFIFVFAYVYPILHNIRQRQVADIENLSPPHF